ncbi:MAG: hypothetical protein ACI8XB_001602 [Patiriisocius sp.]|jgi:hypothetical protein
MKGWIVWLALVVVFLASCKNDSVDQVLEDIVEVNVDILLYSKNPNNHNELYRLESDVATENVTEVALDAMNNYSYYHPEAY